MFFGSVAGSLINAGISIPAEMNPALLFIASDQGLTDGQEATLWTSQGSAPVNATGVAGSSPVYDAAADGGKGAFYWNGAKGLTLSYTGTGTDYTIAAIVAADNTDALRVIWDGAIDPYLGVLPGGQPTFYRTASAMERSGQIWKNWYPIIVRVSGTDARIYVGKTEVGRATISSGSLYCVGLGGMSGYQWLGHMRLLYAENAVYSDEVMSRFVDYLLDQAGKPDEIHVGGIGDSLTAGFDGQESYLVRLQELLGTGYKCHNFGTVAATIVDTSAEGNLAGYIDSNYSALALGWGRRMVGQSVLIYWAGTNDLYYNQSGESTAAAFLADCEAAKAAGHYVIAMNMIDRTESGGWTVAKQSAFNAALAASPSSYDQLVDLATRYNDHTDSAKFWDGTHLKTVEQRWIAENLLYPIITAAAP